MVIRGVALLGCAVLGLACKRSELSETTRDCALTLIARHPTAIEPAEGPRVVDLLVVIDNSSGMVGAQRRLQAAFPRLLSALRAGVSGGRELDLRVGVVSTDLGAAGAKVPGCLGSDGGKLQGAQPVGGCPLLQDRWIALANGRTNVPGCGSDVDACLSDAFACIAALGDSGCGFEAPLEAALRALDPTVNPRFRRSSAALGLLFLTNEDDCSPLDSGFFAQTLPSLPDPLGPLTSFRCFQHGVRCGGTHDPQMSGPRQDCKPSSELLQPLGRYKDALRQLGASTRVVVAAIAGPREPVVVGQGKGVATLEPSCRLPAADGVPSLVATPAIRLGAFVDAFDGALGSICAENYAPALEAFARRLIAPEQCLPPTVVVPNPAIGQAGAWAWVRPCEAGQICDEARGVCMVGEQPTARICGERWRGSWFSRVFQHVGTTTQWLERCKEGSADGGAVDSSCGESCPCWRQVPAPASCAENPRFAPFRIEILRATPAPPGAVVGLAHHQGCWR
jgi:hypothetical protein